MANIYLFGPLLIWFIAQVIKFSIKLIKGQTNLRYLIAAGGMPSAHSAVVCTLAVIALVENGFASPFFGITAIFAAIVMYDSFGVRRSAGDQARVLNQLINDLASSGKFAAANRYGSLREILGHKPGEVTVGAALGIVGGLLLEWPKLTSLSHFLFANVGKLEIKLLYAVAVIVLIAAAIYKWWVDRRFPKSGISKKSANSIIIYSVIGAVVLAIEAFAAGQTAVVLEKRLTEFILVLAASISLGTVYVLTTKRLLAQRAIDLANSRKDHWLKRAGKKK